MPPERRGVLFVDGPSDLSLAPQLERLCLDLGTTVAITALDERLLETPDRTVAGRLGFLRGQGIGTDLVFVHRDAEGRDAAARRHEIAVGVSASGLSQPVVPVVPVTMTEAWILLDEAAIRRVAGKPRGTARLDLPQPHEVERIADPKARLQEILLRASETTGRRRQRFTRDFGRHRALLIAQIDQSGPITRLKAWQQLREDALGALVAVSRNRT